MPIEQTVMVLNVADYGTSEHIYIETQTDTIGLSRKEAKQFIKELKAAIKRAGNK